MMEKLRVLHVVHRLERGGGERQLVDMVKLMSRDRVVHTVCTLYRGHGLESELKKHPVPVIPLRLRGRYSAIYGILQLQKLIAHLQIHILHLWMIDAVLLGRIAHWLAIKRGLTCALVISPQCADYAPEVLSCLDRASHWEFRLKRYLDKFTRCLAPQVQIACSEYEKNSYVDHLDADPDHIRVVYNTTDLSDGYTTLNDTEHIQYRTELGKEGFPRLICVSRLTKSKGQDVLLKAMPLVMRQFPLSTAWLVGDGENRATLEQMCRRLKIEPHVKFLGLRADVKRLLQMADLFVFPTLWDAFGIVLIEAMAAGLPCIASRTGAIPDIIEDGYSGLTFTPCSPEELAERIIELARDPERCKAMGQRGRQIVHERFDAHAAAAAYERSYQAAYQEQILSR